MGYYIHVPGNGEPTLEHTDYEETVVEARRLAMKHGKDVRIYEVKAHVRIRHVAEVHTVEKED